MRGARGNPFGGPARPPTRHRHDIPTPATVLEYSSYKEVDMRKRNRHLARLAHHNIQVMTQAWGVLNTMRAS